MGKKTMIEIPDKKPAGNADEVEQPMDPLLHVQNEENPDNIPPDDRFESPQYEPPAPGEGP